MRFQVAAAAIVAGCLACASAQAPTAVEQLQKGVYHQETVGDLDTAIQIYRQIISSHPSQRTVAAQAQFRLFQALTQKGDLKSAQQEFQNLALNHSEYRELIMAMAGRLGANGSRGRSTTAGTLQNGRYRHELTGIEFNAPPGWNITGVAPSSDSGEMVMFIPANSKAFAAVWLKPDPTPVQNTPVSLRGDLERKHQNRVDVEGWAIRPSSVQNRSVGGQQALSAVADYTEGGRQMRESLTWVRSTKGRCLFFGRASAEDFPALQAGLEMIMATAMVP